MKTSVFDFIGFKIITKDLVDSYEYMCKNTLISLRNKIQLEIQKDPVNEFLQEKFKAVAVCYYKKEYPTTWQTRLNEN